MSHHEYHKIFAALDGAKTQEEVAWKAVRMASDNRAELLFGYVIDSVPDLLAGEGVASVTDAARDRIKKELADVFAAAEADDRIPSVNIVVKTGQIQETLQKEYIDVFEPDLVICGERGLSNITYVFVGSVSTYLIRNVRCDVLVVKQD